MPPTKDQRGQVLSWDEVYAQYADAAESTPIAEIDRQLDAMGYDLDKVGAAMGRLGSQAPRAAGPTVVADVNTQQQGRATSAPAGSVALSLRRGWNAVQSYSLCARWSVASGAFAMLLVAVLALEQPASVVGLWQEATTGKVDKIARMPTSSLEQRVQELIQSVKYAADPLGFAQNLNKAGRLLEAADRSADAVGRYFEAIAIFEGNTDKFKPSPLVATIAHNLARLLLADNRLNEAEKVLERALEINMMHFGPDHPIVARDLASLQALHQARHMCTKPLKACII